MKTARQYLRRATQSLASITTMLSLLFVGGAFAAEWKAGVATTVITPAAPMWMAGYASRTKPSEGKVHDLYAKSLALQGTDGTRLVIVTLDLISVPRDVARHVAAECARRYKLPRQSLLLNASHTHCGPELNVKRLALWGLPAEQAPKIAKYVEGLQNGLVELIGAALADLQPATLSVNQSAAGFAKNRRLPTKNGFINQQYDQGPVDHDVPVLRVADAAGKLRAIAFGYACHNTTLGFQQFCGDYAGFAQEYLQQEHVGATALFVMGAGGDQNPYPRSELDLAKRHGRELTDAVNRAIHGKQTPVEAELKVAFTEVVLDFAPLPSKEELRRQLKSATGYVKRKLEYLLDRLESQGKLEMTYPCPVQVVRLGRQVLLIAVGGEVVVDYSRRLKAELNGGPLVWFAGYSNDVFGYLPSLRVLREGGYEGRDAMTYTTLPGPFAESVEDRVMAAVKSLLKQTQTTGQ